MDDSVITMDSQECHDDNALFDGTTTIGGSSDGDTLTTFGEIIRNMPLEKSEHSRGDVSIFMVEAEAFCGKARANVGECLTDTSADAAASMKTAGKFVKECVDDFCTEEKRRARAEAAEDIAAKLKSGALYCRAQMVSLCLYLLDHPVREVEVSDHLEPNESLTIDDRMTTSGDTSDFHQYERRHTRNRRIRNPPNPEQRQMPRAYKYEDGVFLVPTETEEEPFSSHSETDWEGRDEPEYSIRSQRKDRGGTADLAREEVFPAIQNVDSDGSILRFKESLYRHLSSGKQNKPAPQFQYKDEVTKKVEYSVVCGNESKAAPQIRYEPKHEAPTKAEYPIVVDNQDTKPGSQVEDEKWIDLSDELEPIGVAHLPDSDVSQDQRDEGDSDSTQMVSGSKQPNEIHHVASLPSFPEEHGEMIDCSWIEENDYSNDQYGNPAEYGGAPEFVDDLGAFSQPIIDLTMYE